MIMRHTCFFFSILICLFFISCEEDAPPQLVNSVAAKKASVAYTFLSTGQDIVLLKTNGQTDDPVYILETPFIPTFKKELQVDNIRETDHGIAVKLTDGSEFKMLVSGPDSSAYLGSGLSIVSGPRHYKLFYDDSGPLSDPDVGAIQCKCNLNSTQEKCDTGGKGAADCSISGSASGGGSNFQERCSVKCSTGFYACCKGV